MNTSNYIFDSKLEKIQADYGQEIENYIRIRDSWLEIYGEFGIPFPATSDNNFRDSWFHYRKIYKERNEEEMIRQIANYDEHLQRAERDLVVKSSKISHQVWTYGICGGLTPRLYHWKNIELMLKRGKKRQHVLMEMEN